MSDLLEVRLNDTLVGKLVLAAGERIVFTFAESYLENENRPVLSQSFLDENNAVITDIRPTHTKLPPFFSNLLPEGQFRAYLARLGGINPEREFKLLELLGEDLPGAVKIKALDGLPVIAKKESAGLTGEQHLYRFSLAGVQLKFSALAEKAGGLAIPASGVGGDWIVKLPAQNYLNVPENEFAMLDLAKKIGIDVPEFKLVDIDTISGLPNMGMLASQNALAVKRFDRNHKERIHMEDFAQVFGLFPQSKYEKVSYNNIAHVIWSLTGEAGLKDFIKRLAFNVMIGNGDMHLKNWSLLYPDGKNPELAPAYDYVSTIPYIPNDKLSLTLGATKDMPHVTLRDFEKLAQKASVPEAMVVKTVLETAAALRKAWSDSNKQYPLSSELRSRIDAYINASKIESIKQ